MKMFVLLLFKWSRPSGRFWLPDCSNACASQTRSCRRHASWIMRKPLTEVERCANIFCVRGLLSHEFYKESIHARWATMVFWTRS